jgi:predicted house-cleaning noncanonical NTP pyrophosphatase (MazG superfamily)
MKLVRDKIPELIEADGKKPITHTAKDKEYVEELIKKLYEELKEFENEYKTEELLDLLEVIYAIAETHKISIEELEKLREKKAKERGRFTKKIILDKII